MKGIHRFLPILLISLLSSAFLLFPQSQLQVGYAVLSMNPASNRPAGMALFTYSSADGVILWQAGVGAVEPIRSGRIFVDRTGGTRTALALANPSNQQVGVKLVLRDSQGHEVANVTQTLKPYEHVPRFVEELISGIPQSLNIGSLTFETTGADQRLAAITLRENRNSRNEPLYATLPVADMDASVSKQSLTFPQVAIGGAYKTQIILISKSSQQVRGKIRLFRSDGTPFQLSTGSEIAYQIEAHGAYRLELSDSGPVQAGYATISLDQGDAIPSGTLIFQMLRDGKLMTEAGVAAIPATTKARIFVDRAATETGLALASPGNPATAVTLKWLDRLGRPLGTTAVNLPAGGHAAKFAYELFPGLPSGFTGILEINSSVPVVPVTLMLTNNQRDDLILTTMPVADLTRPTGDKTVVFPQIAFGAGYETRLILINTEIDKDIPLDLSFYQSNGSPLTVPLAGTTSSRFTVPLPQGAANQLRPGNVATLKEIIPDLLDPGGSEIAVNAGSSIYLNPVVLDSSGKIRDDFRFTYVPTNPEIAFVDTQGKLSGRQAGFSTLAISSRSSVKVLTICVVGVSSGITGYIIPGTIGGVTQDRAYRVYTASVTDQTVWLGKSVTSAPELYAGVSQNAGLKNDVRLQSLFRNPTFLAVDELNKVLYVSDAGNKVIRRIIGGVPGKVDTLATDKTWTNPQGLALDTNGYLWVCDTDSHTIRRIFLKDGRVDIVAGSVGKAGYADGTGDQARFNSPVGIAVETEPIELQLEREKSGAPPPTASVIVVDSGNNRIRRVNAAGVVTTIGSLGTGTTSAAAGVYEGRYAAQFSSPVGVAMDAAGNIFVSEPDSNRVKIVLASTGKVVQAVQSGTIVSPRTLAASQYGRILVGTNLGTAQEIIYGQPVITSISPGTVPAKGGVKVTIKGKNFAQETSVSLGNRTLSGVEIRDTETIAFTAKSLPSGLQTLSVENRGGLTQQPLVVQPVWLADLPAGSITTIAGGSTFGGEGNIATLASIGDPVSLALDSHGNVYLATFLNNRVLKVDRRTGVLTSVAGTGVPRDVVGDRGDGKLATAISLYHPSSIAVDQVGNLFIAEADLVRCVNAETGIISKVAGGGLNSGDGGLATSAMIFPDGIWVDPAGNLFIADGLDNRVRKVDSAGIITTVAGNGLQGFSGDGGPAKSAALNSPSNVVTDRSGNLYIADKANNRVRKVDRAGIITTIAGNGVCGFSGDGSQAVSASVCTPGQISFDEAGNLYIADAGNARIRKVNAAGIIRTLAGKGAGFSGDGGLAIDATFLLPQGLAVDSAGQVLIGDWANYRIRLVDTDGKISTIAGNGKLKQWGDGEVAWTAALVAPYGIFSDKGGNLYIADYFGSRIRGIDGKTGIITTVAGGGLLTTENSPALASLLTIPSAVVTDSAGNLLFAEGPLIRKVDAATKVITTIAGRGDSTAENVPAATARLDWIDGIAIDGKDNLFLSLPSQNKIRKIDHATGLIATVAGSGQAGFSGDGGPATMASLDNPVALAVSPSGNIFLADMNNNRVRQVDSKGIITTVAGNGERWSYPLLSGGPATQMSLNQPVSLALDSTGNLYVGDGDYRVVRMDAPTGILTTVAGDWASRQSGFEGDGGPAIGAALSTACGLAFDLYGNLLISDRENARIRAVKGPIPFIPPPPISCDLFKDSFASGDLSEWYFPYDNATWKLSNGKLQVSAVQPGEVTLAAHDLQSSAYFNLSMRVQPDNIGDGFGFMVELWDPLTFTDKSGNQYPVDGIGGWVTGKSEFGLILYDYQMNLLVPFDLAPITENITSLGMEWSSQGISLLLNGTKRLEYPAARFGAGSMNPPDTYSLDLLAAGTTAKIGFSDICQTSLAQGPTTPKR